MVYEEPRFLIGGDSYITLEIGNDGSLHLNLYILQLEKKMREAKYPWLIDTTAMRTTIMVEYDPSLIRVEGVIRELRALIGSGIDIPGVVSARMIRLPILYNDPITRACAKEFDMPPNFEMIARENNMSFEEVIRHHTKPRYFVSYTCFTYGSFGAFPIDSFTPLKNSKYKIPRKWTPPGTLGLGGTTTFYYPSSSPGGLMMLGHIPVRTFDTECKNRYFKEHQLLVYPGDAVCFRSVDEKEYNYIKENADEYVYEIENIAIAWGDNARL